MKGWSAIREEGLVLDRPLFLLSHLFNTLSKVQCMVLMFMILKRSWLRKIMAPPCVCEDFPLLLYMNWEEKCSTEGFIISIISIVIINMIATIKTKKSLFAILYIHLTYSCPPSLLFWNQSLEMLKKMVRLATIQFCLHEMDGVEKHRECTQRW